MRVVQTTFASTIGSFALVLAGCAANPGQGSSVHASPPEPPAAAPAVSDPQAAAIGSAAGSADETLDDEAEESFRLLLKDMGVRYYPARGELEIDGWVNMREGLVEVFACAPEGKTHESVVVLDCVPSGLHAGLLALGLHQGTPVEFGTDGTYRPPTGDRVAVLVRWIDSSGVLRTARAEEWVWDLKDEVVMEQGDWIFAGSFLQEVSDDPTQSTYAANYVKSLVTTYHDASSVLENPHPLGADDTVYYANERAVPAVGTPITAVFRRVEK